MGTLARMDRTGDTRTIWSKDNADEVAAAQAQFNALRKKGFLAFKVAGARGEKGEQITEFDANLEKIIMAPAMQGGN